MEPLRYVCFIALLVATAVAQRTPPTIVQADPTAGPFMKYSLYDTGVGLALHLDKVTATGVSSGPALFRSYQDANLRIVCPALAGVQSMDTSTGQPRYNAFTRGELIYDSNHQVWALADGNHPFILNPATQLNDYGSPLAVSTTPCIVYDSREPTMEVSNQQARNLSHLPSLVTPDLARGDKFLFQPYQKDGHLSYYLAHATSADVTLDPVRFTNAVAGKPLYCPQLAIEQPDSNVRPAELIHDQEQNVWAVGAGGEHFAYSVEVNSTSRTGGLSCVQAY